MHLSPAALLLIALGGALGSAARALATWAIPVGRLPWGTIVVNIAGSLAIGVLIARFTVADASHLRIHNFWVIGFCGGFTTFSSFSWQTFEQIQKGHWVAAFANVILSVVACLFATWLGWRLAR